MIFVQSFLNSGGMNLSFIAIFYSNSLYLNRWKISHFLPCLTKKEWTFGHLSLEGSYYFQVKYKGTQDSSITRCHSPEALRNSPHNDMTLLNGTFAILLS